MRRRALLAASQMGEGNRLEFPLYLNFDYCEESGSWFTPTICHINSTEITVAYFWYLWDMIFKYGIKDGAYTFVENQVLNSLGIEIYLGDEKIIDLYAIETIETIEFSTINGSGIWNSNGMVNMEF